MPGMTPLLGRPSGPVNEGCQGMMQAGRSFWAAVFRRREPKLALAVLAFAELDVRPRVLLQECLYSCVLCCHSVRWEESLTREETARKLEELHGPLKQRLEPLRNLLELQSRLWDDDMHQEVTKERHEVQAIIDAMLLDIESATEVMYAVAQAEKNGQRASFTEFSKFDNTELNSLEEAVGWLRRNHWKQVDPALTGPTRQAYHWAMAPSVLSVVVAQHTPFYGPPREHSLKKVFGDMDRPMFVSCTVPFLVPSALHLVTYLISRWWHRGPGFVGDLYIGLAALLVGISSPLCDAICTDSSALPPEQHPIYGNELPLVTWPDHPRIRANSRLNNWSRGFDRTTAVMVVPTSLLVYLVVTQEWPALTRGAATPPFTLLGILGTFIVGNANCLLGQKARARDPVGRRSRAAKLFRFQHAVLWHGCLGILLTASFALRKVPWTQQGARLSDQRLAMLNEHVASMTGGIGLTAMLAGIGAVYIAFNVMNTLALLWKEFWAYRRNLEGSLNPGEHDSYDSQLEGIDSFSSREDSTGDLRNRKSGLVWSRTVQ